MSEELVKNQYTDVAKKLDGVALSVLGAENVHNFEKSYMMALAIKDLSTLLSPDYMKPIMFLQGNKLGFKTDKDKDGGYPEPTVKNCLIEATLLGLQSTGNHFNIIAGNMYATKEGLGHLLNKIKGLKWRVIPGIPTIKDNSALVTMKIEWSMNGGNQEVQELPIPIKVNNFMGVDAVIGKATRKARHWLFSNITGLEVGEGDVQDIVHVVVDSKTMPKVNIEDKETQRLKSLISQCNTTDELECLLPDVGDNLQSFYQEKYDEILGNLNR